MSRSTHPTLNMDEKISISIKEESQISEISISVKEESQISASESKIVSSKTQVDYLSSSFTEPGLRRSVEIPLPTFTSQLSYASPFLNPEARLASATQQPNYPGPFGATFSSDNFKSARSLSYSSPSFNIGQPSAYRNKPRFDLNVPPSPGMEMFSSEGAIRAPYIPQGNIPNDREKGMLRSFQKVPYFTSTLVPSRSRLSYPTQSIPKNQLNLRFNPSSSISRLSNYSDLNYGILNSYLSSTQGPERKYKCTMCPAEFATPQAYGGHMSSHSKSRKSQFSEEGSSQGKKARPSPLVPAENEKALRGHVNEAKQVQVIKDAEVKKEE